MAQIKTENITNCSLCRLCPERYYPISQEWAQVQRVWPIMYEGGHIPLAPDVRWAHWDNAPNLWREKLGELSRRDKGISLCRQFRLTTHEGKYF